MKKIVATEDAPKAIGPYSQAVMAGGFLFISGQIPLDPASMKITGMNAAEQARRVFANMGVILRAAGMDFNNVVKTTVLLKNIADFAAVNEVYASHFSGDFPARATFQVAALPMDALVEIEAVACKEDKTI